MSEDSIFSQSKECFRRRKNFFVVITFNKKTLKRNPHFRMVVNLDE